MIECIEGIVKRKTSGPIRMDFFFRFFFLVQSSVLYN